MSLLAFLPRTDRLTISTKRKTIDPTVSLLKRIHYLAVDSRLAGFTSFVDYCEKKLVPLLRSYYLLHREMRSPARNIQSALLSGHLCTVIDVWD